MGLFQNELRSLINEYGLENASDTPDFILAEYLEACLRAFDAATRARERLYSKGLVETSTHMGDEEKER